MPATISGSCAAWHLSMMDRMGLYLLEFGDAKEWLVGIDVGVVQGHAETVE